MTVKEFTHFNLFSGIGVGASGFNLGHARVGEIHGRFRCLGGVDVDPVAIADFARIAGVPGTVLDLFDREQYTDFHGRAPDASWREATPADIQRAAGGERPNVVFLSPPCKGFSGLVSNDKSQQPRYRALNRLTLRGVFLMLEAWASDPPEFVLLENVPLLAQRGKHLLAQIVSMLQSYGYATASAPYDCGKLAGLSQSRKRFLLVARHTERVAPMLYQPPQQSLRGVGEVLARLPVPGSAQAGPMHQLPALAWKTWVRLSLVEAGKDWRSLSRLEVVDGHLRDLLIVPAMFNGGLGVRRWHDASGAVAGESLPLNGAYSVADPRPAREHHSNAWRVTKWDHTAGTVTAGMHVSGGGGVADPRSTGPGFAKYSVTPWVQPSPTVIAGSTTGQGAFAVADPRPVRSGRLFTKYPVSGWAQPSGCVIGGDDCGAYAVADPRIVPDNAGEPATAATMPSANDRLVAYIQALDGTWHRPYTTLELAALQTIFDPDNPAELSAFTLSAASDEGRREHIGNAVPRMAAKAIADEMLRALLMSAMGRTFDLSAAPIWVRPLMSAVSLSQAPEREQPAA